LPPFLSANLSFRFRNLPLTSRRQRNSASATSPSSFWAVADPGLAASRRSRRRCRRAIGRRSGQTPLDGCLSPLYLACVEPQWGTIRRAIQSPQQTAGSRLRKQPTGPTPTQCDPLTGRVLIRRGQIQIEPAIGISCRVWHVDAPGGGQHGFARRVRTSGSKSVPNLRDPSQHGGKSFTGGTDGIYI
jgi:hypothetical protein